ncbi:Arv1-like family-domain-containing protein [Russula vinacea]|nr:Arv1-like family-domain-containing protein [Russula vinacea]
MPLCTNCAQAIPYLYTVYHSVNNVRLEQCPSCRAPADPYVEHDAFVVALDLVLLKPEVYRHLLFNRGTPPRKVEETATARGQDDDGLQKELWLIVRVGAGVVLVDSFVRWSRLRKDFTLHAPLRRAAVAFMHILLGCFVETASFHGGITWRPSYSHISLCLFYSSLTKFLLLVVLSIWGPQVPRGTRLLPHTYTRCRVLDRTWLVRNLLGGMSAGFGLRVVLDCHPFFTSLIILLGCAVKTVVVSLVQEFVGPGNGVEETWLAYSIP